MSVASKRLNVPLAVPMDTTMGHRNARVSSGHAPPGWGAASAPCFVHKGLPLAAPEIVPACLI
jgi:hypothetical protein